MNTIDNYVVSSTNGILFTHWKIQGHSWCGLQGEKTQTLEQQGRHIPFLIDWTNKTPKMNPTYLCLSFPVSSSTQV